LALYYYFLSDIKETLIKSTCADCRQIFSLARRKSAGILDVFQDFSTQSEGKDGGKMCMGIYSVVP
jgi:hypothetical protein